MNGEKKLTYQEMADAVNAIPGWRGFSAHDMKELMAAIEEARTRAGTTPTTPQGSAESPGKPGTEARPDLEPQAHKGWCDLRRPEYIGECTCSMVDGSTATIARRLADEIEHEGIERVVYGKSHSELVAINWALVAALREYALIGIGQRIMDSSDAQHFRWLLKHHSGSEVLGSAARCWIGGVEFRGTDVRDAIDAAIEKEDKERQ